VEEERVGVHGKRGGEKVREGSEGEEHRSLPEGVVVLSPGDGRYQEPLQTGHQSRENNIKVRDYKG